MKASKFLKLLMKFLHEVGSYGLAGGFAAQLIVLAQGEAEASGPLVGAVARWLTAPSLVLVLLSGLLAMVLRPTFFTKGWVWLKAFLTVPTIYATVGTYPGVRLIVGDRTPRLLWLALVVAVVITVLSVWRPKRILLSTDREGGRAR